MEDMNEYWMEYPPLFSNIEWNIDTTNEIPPTTLPFQRRRSSSVDLPINPLYLNSNRFTFGNTTTIKEEEEQLPSKIGSSSVKNIRYTHI